MEQINFYVSFERANTYCVNRSVNGRVYRFSSLADILKQINDIEENSNRKFLFSKARRIKIPFPISPLNSQFPLEQKLLLGEYTPVLWNATEYGKISVNEVPTFFNDLYKIPVNRHVMIVRYNEKKDCIEFYDGKLKKVLPGQKPSLGEGCCFDFKGMLINYFKNSKF